jgi:hypothetical protein
MEDKDKKTFITHPYIVQDTDWTNGYETEELAIEAAKKDSIRGDQYAVYKLVASTAPTTAHILVTRH